MQSILSEVEVDFDIDSPIASKVEKLDENRRVTPLVLEDNCSETEAEYVEEELIREIVTQSRMLETKLTHVQEVGSHVEEEFEERKLLDFEEEVELSDETRIAGITWASLKRSAVGEDYQLKSWFEILNS